MAEEPALDPRYDPAFQRGYGDRPVSTGTRSAAAPHVTSALQRPAVREFGATPEPDRPEAIPDAAPAAAPQTATEATPASVVQVAPALRPPWTNPFAIAVTIIGIAVFGVGVWLLQETYQLTQSETGFQTQADYWFLQWGMIGGPIFAGLGVAILVAVLVLCAAYWARRPLPDERD
ncbi:tetraspanin family protein [Protaetiibacter mangrovi]|uniref:Tetraspanin family protein n=1 Tax=Protaetiibacter mangrovi TaxID=2970926 RepID=A0ABT1ZD24_9MICO|nr:tetraspanin family protein [Protaetiibacter mangrovi]MCS0498592.1 tetraspanin family protein [Protaetiibacter mangrovi]TPX03153.1 tetraspanin family protein [Schumannella luteola]